ncbi:hypothetical protein [Flavobacterium aestivum]|uniref:hypothetical protein n=1 Tax=Flavobacterium aestivum TaxID=3003257 RepID=UPI002285926B|nr:hypothetical protein [Flavobacterium aestivum]
MNKEVVIIGGGVCGGLVSSGLTALLPYSESPIINLAVAGASAFGATRVKGASTKDNLLKGALVGSTLTQVAISIKKIATKNLSARLIGDGKATQFMKGAVGLACPYEDGLNGAFMGGDGHVYQYDENGLNGTYIDEAGNIFQENGLNGTFTDEYGNVFQVQDGLHGALEDELYQNGLQGAEEYVYGEDGLHGAEEDLYNEIY